MYIHIHTYIYIYIYMLASAVGGFELSLVQLNGSAVRV